MVWGNAGNCQAILTYQITGVLEKYFSNLSSWEEVFSMVKKKMASNEKENRVFWIPK